MERGKGRKERGEEGAERREESGGRAGQEGRGEDLDEYSEAPLLHHGSFGQNTRTCTLPDIFEGAVTLLLVCAPNLKGTGGCPRTDARIWVLSSVLNEQVHIRTCVCRCIICFVYLYICISVYFYICIHAHIYIYKLYTW